MAPTPPWLPTQKLAPTGVPLVLPFSGGNFTLGAPSATSIDVNAVNLFYVVEGNFTSDLTIDFNGNIGVWQIDTGSATLNGFGVVIQNGTATARLTASSIFTVSLPAANLITLIAPVPAAFLDLAISGGYAHTLTGPESLIGFLVCSGNLASNATLAFPIVGVYLVDTSQVTFNGFAFNLQSGAAVAPLTVPSIFTVSIPAMGTIVVQAPFNVPTTRVTLVNTAFVPNVDETIVIVNQNHVGAPTVTLPLATSLASGQKFTVAVNSLFPSGSFTNVVASPDATLINGAASIDLTYAYGSTEFTFVHSGTAEFWIASHTAG
jgi:hypothetical protein